MAKLFGQNSAVDFASTNLMSFGKSFSRLNGQPLDKSEVWYDKAALEAYALTDAAYVGQKVFFVDVENATVTHYGIEVDGSLKELGTTPIGDDKSIVVDEDGTISIKGFDALTAAEDKFLPRVKWVAATDDTEAHAEIEWVSVSAVVEGDGNTVTKVTSTDGSVSVTETKDTENDTITYDLSVPEYGIQRDGYVEGSKERSYHLTKDGEAFGVAITVPVAYDDTELASKVAELEEKVGYKADQSELEAGLALKANSADIYTKTATDNLLNAKANSADVYTKTEADNLLAVKANSADVYTKTEADELFNAKANSADVYAKSEVYTKTETDTKIGEAIAAADHLKRVIIDAPEDGEEIEDVIDEWLIANSLDAKVADQYIYMIPSGLTADDNKYYEYIVVFEGENRYVEQVGNWEVDLTNYVTNTSLATTLGDYVKTTDLPTDHVTKGELETTLEDYALVSDIPTDYVSTEDIKAYDTAEVANDKYAGKDATEQALADRYTKEEADVLLGNKANSDSVYTKDEANALLDNKANSADVYTSSKVDELLADKADATSVYTKEEANALLGDKANSADVYTKDEADSLLNDKANSADVYTKGEVDGFIGTPGTPEVGKPEDENYQPAVAGTGVYQHVYSKNEITDLIADITGGESAADVKAELTAYKTSNDAEVGIIKAKVGTIAEGAEVNVIHSVDSNIFSVVTDSDNSIDRQLQLVKVPVGKLEGLTNEFELDIENNVLGIAKINVSKLEGLTDWITTNRETVPGLYPVEAKNLLDSLNALVNDETNGLNKKVDEHNSRIATLEDAMTWKNL